MEQLLNEAYLESLRGFKKRRYVVKTCSIVEYSCVDIHEEICDNV